MAKFRGEVGYIENVEKRPGIWAPVTTKKTYSGDVIKNVSRWQAGDKVNDDLTLDNLISIIADPFAYQKFHAIKYVKWMGATWKVTKVDVQRPRLILTIGGVYNERQA